MRLLVLMAETDPAAWQRAGAAYRDEVAVRHQAFHRAVRERGRMLAGEALAAAQEALTVRPGRGVDRPVVAGPYAESAGQLTGFYLIEVDSIETAVELARMLPGGYSVELRPAIDLEAHAA